MIILYFFIILVSTYLDFIPKFITNDIKYVIFRSIKNTADVGELIIDSYDDF
jgi:hypothetical protein